MKLARGALLAFAAAALLLTGCGTKSKVREPAKLVEIVKPEVRPVQIWSRSAGNGGGRFYSGLHLSLEADALYAAAVDGGVFAISPANGATIWRTETKARIISGPSVSGDKVFVGTLDGDAIALQRSTGKELWRSKVPSEIMAAPVASGDIVVIRSVDGREYGVSALDGSRLWSFDRTVPNLTLRGLSEPLILGNRVFTGMDNGKLTALNLADGAVAWEQNISVPTGRSPLDQLTDIDADLLPTPIGIVVVTYGNDIALLDPVNGESRWRRSIKSYTGMTSDDKQIYVSDDDGLIWSLDGETGGATWKQEALKYRRLSAPAVFGHYLVAGDYKGYLHWFEMTEGRLVARTSLGGDAIAAAPVSDGKRLYVTDVKGRIAAFENAPVK